MKRGKRSKIRQALGVWENRKSNGKKKNHFWRKGSKFGFRNILFPFLKIYSLLNTLAGTQGGMDIGTNLPL
jgi:hypothetical protein